MRGAGVLLVWLVMGACSGEEARSRELAPTGGAEQRRAEEGAPVEPTPAPRRELDPDTECGRALACCRAFAAAIPNVAEASACAGPFEAAEESDADARCRRMRAGWREALTLASGEAPEACADPEP